MKVLASISGDFEGVELVVYLNHPSITGTHIDSSKLGEYEAVVSLTDFKNLGFDSFKVAECPSGYGDFLWVNVKSVNAVPHTIHSNIKIKVTYSLSAIGKAVLIFKNIRRYFQDKFRGIADYCEVWHGNK